MKLDLELAGLVLGLLAVSTTGLFSIISLDLGEEWSIHIKTIYLLIFVIFVLIAVIFLTLIGGKNKDEIK